MIMRKMKTFQVKCLISMMKKQVMLISLIQTISCQILITIICDEFYADEENYMFTRETTTDPFLSIFMACGRKKTRGKHGKHEVWQAGMWGLQNNHHNLPMIKNIMFVVGCCLVLVLRKGEWNKLIGQPKDHGKDNSNLRANSLQPWRMMQIGMLSGHTCIPSGQSILPFSLLFELGSFVTLLLGLVFFFSRIFDFQQARPDKSLFRLDGQLFFVDLVRFCEGPSKQVYVPFGWPPQIPKPTLLCNSIRFKSFVTINKYLEP